MTFEQLTDDDILNDTHEVDDGKDRELASDGESDPVIERQGISYFQVCQHIEVELRFFMLSQQNSGDEHFTNLGKIEDWINILRERNQVQKKITEFFQPGSPHTVHDSLNEGKRF